MSQYRIPIGAPCIGTEETEAVLRALNEKRLSQGRHVKDFEDAYAVRLYRKYAVATNSGSSANLIALSAMKELYGWKAGDRVLVPALTFATAVSPVLQLGLKPIWCDVDEDGNMSFKDGLLKAIAAERLWEIKGCVLVHSLGVAARDTLVIRDFCEAYGIRMLEDLCESHGARIKAPIRPAGESEVGTFGDISTLSFFVAHNITTGEGGMAFTDSLELNCLMRSYREFGRTWNNPGWQKQADPLGYYHSSYTFDRLGYNVRMTDLEAAIGMEQLKRLDAFNSRRREIVTRIRQELDPLGFYDLPDECGRLNSYYSLKLGVANRQRDQLAAYLEKHSIETRPFMGGNLLRQQAFADGTSPERFPAADALHHNTLCVGCHPGLSDEDVGYLITKLREFPGATP